MRGYYCEIVSVKVRMSLDEKVGQGNAGTYPKDTAADGKTLIILKKLTLLTNKYLSEKAGFLLL